MNYIRGGKRRSGLCRAATYGHRSNERQDDELQSNQSAGRGTDDDVEVLPFGECCHAMKLCQALYCSSLTCSIQSTALPFFFSWMAMCVMAVVGAAPCQCFSPGENQTTSPGRISSIGPPQRCARPHPAVTMSVCPSGCVCHAVLAPGSKVTLAPAARAGSGAWKRGSIRTVPVNHSAGPFPDGCEPIRLMSMISPYFPFALGRTGTPSET